MMRDGPSSRGSRIGRKRIPVRWFKTGTLTLQVSPPKGGGGGWGYGSKNCTLLTCGRQLEISKGALVGSFGKGHL